MNEIIVGKNITTSYGDKIMHDNVSWSVKEAEIYGFLGGSGTGKTTLMKTMIYLKKPNKGDITFDGVNMWKSSSEEQQEIKLKSGTMFQFGALYSSMTILDNVGVLLHEYSKFNKRQIDEIAMFWLSGGMKKRAALARALVLSPRVLFLDEPNSGLDPVSSRQMDALIKELRDSIGVTVVMVTHDADSIFDILDRFLIIDNKKIAFEGDIKELEHLENNPLEELFKMRKK